MYACMYACMCACMRICTFVLSRCHIGHSWLTHAFLLKGEPVPECIGCQSPLTIKHFLLNCVYFMTMHQQFYSANSMHEHFTKKTF